MQLTADDTAARRSGTATWCTRHPSEPDLLYIDLHLVHEVTSPQAFDGLRLSGPRRAPPRPHRRHRGPQRPHRRHRPADRRPDLAPARSRCCARTPPSSASSNFPMGDPGQGIVHVIGPEQGRTLPGMTIVCGDSHTATHGAFGALAFGIGTSEVEHVLATQTLPQQSGRSGWPSPSRASCPAGVTAKDIILAIIGRIGTGGGIGHVIEYRGSAIRALSMEGRMTRLQHVDRGRRQGRPGRPRRDDLRLPRRAARTPRRAPTGTQRVADWRTLVTDEGAVFDKEVVIDATTLRPAGHAGAPTPAR